MPDHITTRVEPQAPSAEAKYRDWISDNYPTQQSAYGKCADATARMIEHFPELKRVRGHYQCLVWGEREHWWCVAPDGTIVDPTVKQFPSRGGKSAYTELPNDAKEPTGICPECGEYIYDGREIHQGACATRYLAYLMG